MSLRVSLLIFFLLVNIHLILIFYFSLEPNINNFASNNNHNSSEDDTSANTAELESETLMQEAENLMKNATKDGKFKRLQLKWEMLSSKDTRTPTNGRLSTPSSPAKSW